MTAREQATGRCTSCGAFPVRGALVSQVETNSGPFWANVRCTGCAPAVRLSAAPVGFHAQRRRGQ